MPKITVNLNLQIEKFSIQKKFLYEYFSILCDVHLIIIKE